MAARRLFSLAEANSLLTVLEPMLQLLQFKFLQLQQRRQEFAVLFQQRSQGNGHDVEQEATVQAAQAELDQLSREVEQGIEEVESFGCEVKDAGFGLVDFRTHRGDREVYLCFHLGETQIGYWHELDSGIAGRQRL